MKPWEEKANRIIGTLCLESWRKANHDKNGKRYKRHVPYSVPEDAQTLVDCLKTGDEVTAKSLFIRMALQ
jgi:hypothetical protein